MSKSEVSSQTVDIESNKNVNKDIIPFTDIEATRITSLTAVLSYLVLNGEIDVKSNYNVLDLGTGSGVGVYVWRAFGVDDRNITALDVEENVNLALLGQSTFVKTDAQIYLEKTAGQINFDIVSAFRIPQAYHDYTKMNCQLWLNKISELLRDDKSYYLETYSEWGRLYDLQSRNNPSPLQASYFSFMGDKLDVPDLPLLKQPGLPSSVMMGHPDGVFEETTYLNESEWVPCDSETGERKLKINPTPYYTSGYFGLDEYGVWAHYNNGRKEYDFGQEKRLRLKFGYTDNLVVLYRKEKIPVIASTIETRKTEQFANNLSDTTQKSRRRIFNIAVPWFK